MTTPLLLSLGALLPTAASAQAYDGRLEAGDATLTSGEYRDTYTVVVHGGESLTVDMVSDDFDPYLILHSPSGEQMENDDFEGSLTRSRVEVPDAEAGTWEVVATSYQPGEMGQYGVVVEVDGRRGPAVDYPEFADFPAGAPYTGTHAAVRLTTPDARTFRTRLRAAGAHRPDFAGRYVLAVWGCGASCETGAAVNVATGDVVWLPGTVCCQSQDDLRPMVEAYIESRLVRMSGLINESGEVADHYFELTDGAFQPVASIPVDE